MSPRLTVILHSQYTCQGPYIRTVDEVKKILVQYTRKVPRLYARTLAVIPSLSVPPLMVTVGSYEVGFQAHPARTAGCHDSGLL